MGKELQVLSVMSELGAGTRGASLGYEALKIASIKSDIKFFTDRKVKTLPTENHLLFEKDFQKTAVRLTGIAEMYAHIEEEVAQTINKAFPLVITGDHSNAGGTIAGIKKANPDKRLGVVWVDAHSDLHSPYTTPTGNIHGMPLATALGMDNLENQNTQPDDASIKQWNRMKGVQPRILPDDLFFVGVRDSEDPEQNLMKKYGIPNVTVDELRQTGVSAVTEMVQKHLADCDLVYISFDVDSMDPSVSTGTGTPVEHGLTEAEARELLLLLVADKRLCCFEITEINPLLDTNKNSMAEAAFRILKPVVEKIEKNL